jgi:hypothetical protein
MMPINELKLAAKIDDPGKLVKLKHNGEMATNSKISFNFGNRKCNLLATAYKETAEMLCQLTPGTKVIINGAIYQEKYQDKNTNEEKIVDKIRITSFKLCDIFDTE